jgi:endonuclease G
MKKNLLYLIIIAVAAAWYYGKHDAKAAETSSKINVNGLEKVISNPSLDEKLISYEGMTVSFNPEKHQPNWVAWELTGEEAQGAEPRSNNFTVDENVPGCATLADYRNSGYDRGHIAPAGDMKWSTTAMNQSFMLTNICPQEKALNTGSWKSLEEKCRQWAQIDSAIIIVAGPVLTDHLTDTIGPSRIPVPKRFFKVILSPYANPPRGIGFIMNNGRVEGGMQAAAVSIDEVEKVTGHDFFSNLPDDVENAVESECRFHYWSTLK